MGTETFTRRVSLNSDFHDKERDRTPKQLHPVLANSERQLATNYKFPSDPTTKQNLSLTY